MKKLLFVFTMMCLATFVALGNKTSVTVKAPEKAEKGTEITITINVMHSGNSRLHHTDWVYLKINGKEVKRWEYDKRNLPPDENFALEYKYVIPGEASDSDELIIEAEGNCNVHGSDGESKVTIKVL